MQLKRSDFVYDQKINVWCLPSGPKKFNYSDGAEQDLYNKITACDDRSIYSEELLPYKDWPEEYHLSPVRCNLLIGIKDFIGSGKKVLELGSGCGSITRYLGEQGHAVIAIEGSIDRARVAGARCSDLPNVQIFCTDFQNIDFTDEGFDVVTLIGVFEYSALYWKGPTPYKSCLEFVNKHCCEKTSFILAIENQLGIKYLNGMPEDHMGREFYGINDLYQSECATPQTFTREELSKLVSETLSPKHIQFLGLFPDYKLPSLMLTEAAFANEGLRAYQIVSTIKSRHYSASHFSLFHEGSLFRVLQREGVAFSFSNSFLLLVSKEERSEIDWLAKTISNNRKAAYNTETTIRCLENALCVEKRRFTGGEVDNPEFSFEIAPYSAFYSGDSLFFEIERALLFSKDNSWKTLRKNLVEWAVFLKENCIKNSSMLAGEWFDATPRNIIRADGSFVYFDREWKLKKPIDVRVVIIRGIVDLFSTFDPAIWSLQIPHKNLKALIHEICSAVDLTVNDGLYETAWSTNAMLYSSAYPGKEYDVCYEENKKQTLKRLLFLRFQSLFIQKYRKLLPWGIYQAKRFRNRVLR